MRQSIIQYKHDGSIRDSRLRDYQNEDVNFLLRVKNKGVFNQQRTGKTPTTIVALRESNHNKNLIVTTKSNIYTWLQEYIKWHGGYAVIANGAKKYRLKKYQKFTENTTFIISYGTLSEDYLDIVTYLKNFDSVVFDEASLLQNFKGSNSKYTTKQTKAIMAVGNIAESKYALTGTPAPNYAYDIFGILHLLYPDIFASYWRFIDYYFGSEGKQINRQGKIIHKEKHKFLTPQKEQELAEFLELISIQRKRRDILKWLEEPDYEVIVIPMEHKQNIYYKHLSKYYEVKEIVAIDKLDLMIKQRMLSISPTILGLEEKSNKTRWILDYLEEYPNTPLIITSFFSSYLKELYQTLLALNYNVGLMIGNTPPKTRNTIKDSFQNGKLNIILGNHDVIKYGLTLDRAETIIFTDESLMWETNDQVKDRIVATSKERLEAKEGQKIIILLSEDSIEEYIHQRLQEKADNNKIVNDYIKLLKEVS